MNIHAHTSPAPAPAAPARARALWARLRAGEAGLGDVPPADDDLPWYLAALLGIAAWVAAGFLFGFFATLFTDLFRQPGFTGTLGAICCVSALGLMRYARGKAFVEQFAVALSLAGQVLCGVALHEALGDIEPHALGTRLAWAGTSALALAMVLLGPVALHRFLSGALCAAALALTMSIEASLPARAMAAPLLAALTVGLWRVTEWAPALRGGPLPMPARLSPLAWGITLVALVMLWMGADLGNSWEFRDKAVTTVRMWHWLGSAAIVSLLPLCAVWLARGSAWRWRWVGAAAVFALLLAGAPGVAFGMALVLLGFGLHRPALLGVGLLGMAIYLIRYYYQLDVPLLQKSGWLLAAGAALLLARLAGRRIAPEGVA